MIEINLLPDIKRQYLKSQRIKQLFILGSFGAVVIAGAGVILMWFFTLGQNYHMDRLQEDIVEKIEELQAVEDLDKVVTVQNQLRVIESISDTKPEAKQLFNYLTKVTPDKVDLGSVIVDFSENQSIEISGLGSDFKAINTFIDVLKNATFTYKDADGDFNAFNSVVLAGQGEDDSTGKKSFKIEMGFNEGIFDNNLEDLVLSVPTITSTQSETQRPKSLFDPEAQPDTENEESGEEGQ